ncbi:MAG: sensor domain-containing diguanylate cyclase [Actinomycetota bacterium]|nr:sensor domain-containing diguanylate cyclase [Actinomycetota bacterium]
MIHTLKHDGRRRLRLKSLRAGSEPTTVVDARAASREAWTIDRLSRMQALRASVIAVVLWTGLFSVGTIGISLRDTAAFTVFYAALVGATETLRRAWGGVGAVLAGAMLIADALYLAWILHTSGGILSPLRFLVYIHLIAVTLMFSYRTGILIAVLHSVLLFAVYQTQVTAGASPALLAVGEGGMSLHQSWLFNTLAFWIVTLATAPFSSLNERELRRRKADLEVLTDMTNEIENLRDPRVISETVLERVCETFEFHRGVVLAVQENQLVLMARRGTSQMVPPSPRLDKLIDRAWDEREAVLVARLKEETDPALSALLPFGRNLLVAPMFADGQAFGVLVVERGQEDEPVLERRIISMVMQFASHGALAMRNASLLEEVQRLAETDALTEIANRRSFEKALDREISRSMRNGESFTLVMVDLDNFKFLNDQFGHQAGDELLQKVGSVLRKACRESDTPSRYGGEEFAVLLPGCGVHQSLEAAERLRALIAGVDGPMRITASAGVATYPTQASTATGLIEAADEALYESKRAGRDRSTRSSRRVVRAMESLGEVG